MVAAVVLTASAALASSAQARLWGVDYNYPSLPYQDLTRMQATGIQSVRITIYRPQVEPREGQFNWSAPDQAIGDLASRGIEAFPVLYGSPPYAGRTDSHPPLKTAAIRAGWQDFVRRAVARYGPGGDYWTSPLLYHLQHPGAQPLPIHSWQPWNEPNISNYFQPHPSAKRYARLVRITHKGIKQADRRASLVLAGMPGLVDYKPWVFLNRLYKQRGIKHAFEGAAIHPYAPRLGQVENQIRRFRKVLRKHGDGSLPLYITELGWGSRKRGGALNIGRKGQARMLKRSFRLIAEHRRAWQVRRVYWYTWRDVPKIPGHCTFCDSAGLLKADYRTKPAWNAFAHFTGVR
jgi:hypothetical protein